MSVHRKYNSKLQPTRCNVPQFIYSKTSLSSDNHMSVHRKYNSKLQPTRCNISFFLYFSRCPTCFRRFLRPSSGAHNCTYNFIYCQPVLLLAASVDMMERHLIHASSKQQYCLTIPEAVCTVMCS